ncbi:hypothetical protein BV22DRAFT_1199825 [Leucogyrophana mollusca]|uniref:Uncharacterized protein n=1 Tax=Leucogyrophana mollusca TaxID=85980 RepID=A0ACB8B0P1_9AGAM|nr:hypothetical protein BV22DRAFT_1199825 [Leucogyrophana mollusca]
MPDLLAFHRISAFAHHYHRSHPSHIRTDRMGRSACLNARTVFILGAASHTTAIMVTNRSTVSDIMDTLLARGLVPAHYRQSHFLCLPGFFGRRLDWDELLSPFVVSLSHLHLRLRLPGGAGGVGAGSGDPPATQVIHVRPITRLLKKKAKGRPGKLAREDVWVLPAVSSSSGQHERRVNQTTYSMDNLGNVSARNRAISLPEQACSSDPSPLHSHSDDIGLDDNFHWDDSAAAWDSGDGYAVPSKRKRTAGDHPLLHWVPERGSYLDELIRHEGRGDRGRTGFCNDCGTESSQYRCEDCFGEDMLCIACAVKRHRASPLHRLKEWNGTFFERVTLKSLGLRIQLGHQLGESCPNPECAFGDAFVVIDSHGIHEVGVDFCGCEIAQTRTKQLLRARWFPSTSVDPKSAATFRALEEYHLLSFELKVSAYEFYGALVRRTDNTGLTPPKDRYDAFMRMVRKWRHLKMLKRSGRGHDPEGVDATKEGECAVLCPACPHPGKNLPADWESVPAPKRWLYALFIAIDANFRLKRKLVSSDSADPGLSAGLAFFVPEKVYKAYLKAHDNYAQEKSTCVSHSAVNMADTKSARGLAASGIGTVDCARHNMKLPNGVGDLQKGERYINMDYLFFSAVRGSAIQVFNVSYDIACQWHKHLWSRMGMLPSESHIDVSKKIINFFVPKFHLPAHIPECQTRFSFNFIKGVGRTDGEAPERGWSNINPVSSSTKEMGPGSRRDTLDDHFGDWNWKKVAGLGRSLFRKYNEAKTESLRHQSALDELEAALPQDSLAQWRFEVEAWENDRSQTNPYETKVQTITQAAVRLQLAQDESEELREGNNPSMHMDVSPSMLVSSGIDLEDQQRRVKAERSALSAHATDSQKARLQQTSNTLQRKVEAWIAIQVLYMPPVSLLRARAAGENHGDEPEKPEDIKLWLPSQLEPSVTCDTRLQNYEWRLRFAQAGDALNDVRRYVRLESYLLGFKDRNLRGQGANTRARNTLAKVAMRRETAKSRYDAARGALKALGGVLGKVGWESAYQELTGNDMRSIQDLLAGETEGRRTLSWIWKTSGILSRPDNDEGLQDGVALQLRVIRS